MENKSRQNPADEESRRHQRQTELRNWLDGNGELTEEEQKIAGQFGGPNAEMFARRAVALHRKTQALKVLNSEKPLNEEEEQLKSKFGGKDAGLFFNIAASLNRKSKILKWLSGDEDADINI